MRLQGRPRGRKKKQKKSGWTIWDEVGGQVKSVQNTTIHQNGPKDNHFLKEIFQKQMIPKGKKTPRKRSVHGQKKGSGKKRLANPKPSKKSGAKPSTLWMSRREKESRGKKMIQTS